MHSIVPRKRRTSLKKLASFFQWNKNNHYIVKFIEKLPECFCNHKSNLNHRHPDKSSAISPEMMNSATRPGVMGWSADQQCEWYWLMRGQHLLMCQWLHRDVVNIKLKTSMITISVVTLCRWCIYIVEWANCYTQFSREIMLVKRWVIIVDQIQNKK